MICQCTSNHLCLLSLARPALSILFPPIRRVLRLYSVSVLSFFLSRARSKMRRELLGIKQCRPEDGKYYTYKYMIGYFFSVSL